MDEFDETVDVLVAGAGMAGLAAAIEAQQADAEVLVLEKGPRAGGSMYLSAGIVYTYDSLERAREEVPGGDPALQQLVIEQKEEALDWLAELGVNLREPSGDVTFGSGKQLDPVPFTERMVDRIRTNGGRVHLETPMTGLVSEAGRVEGVTAENPEGESFSIGADATVLATGGFQGNANLVEQFVTPDSDRLWLRSNPWSTGDGLQAAADVGAKQSGGMDGFYGHNLPAPPAEIPPEKLLDAKQAYGVRAVAIDRDGNRFVDETASPYEVVLTQATARKAGGEAYYIVDEDLYESTFVSRSVRTSIQTAAELGGRVGRADDLNALETLLFDWDVNGEKAVETLTRFNEAVRAKAGERLQPPRRNEQNPIDTPPFRVVPVQPGITFTMGGLSVTPEMAVLRQAGTSSMLAHTPEDPASVRSSTIPNLFAAGMDVGGLMRTHYFGGLATALVTGRVAGRNAAV